MESREEVELLFKRYNDLMIQEFMNGVEYGADVYIDMISGKQLHIFIKEKSRCEQVRLISRYLQRMKNYFG